MPTCQNCKREWTWKQTIRRMFYLKCPYCGKKQYESAASKKRTPFGLVPLIVLPIGVLLNFQWWLVAGSIGLLTVAILCIYPYFLQLSNEEEALW